MNRNISLSLLLTQYRKVPENQISCYSFRIPENGFDLESEEDLFLLPAVDAVVEEEVGAAVLITEVKYMDHIKVRNLQIYSVPANTFICRNIFFRYMISMSWFKSPIVSLGQLWNHRRKIQI